VRGRPQALTFEKTDDGTRRKDFHRPDDAEAATAGRTPAQETA